MNDITFPFDEKNKIPLYLQLYTYLKEEIRNGNLAPREKLPSKRLASVSLGVSVNTVEGAYKQLEAEGYIESRARSGFYVCEIDELICAQVEAAQAASDCTGKPLETYAYRFDTSNVDNQFFPYTTWGKINKKLLYNSPDLLELGENKGDAALRRTLCAFLRQTRGVNCEPEQIIVGAGSEYLITLLVTLIGREKTYATENPCYEKTYRIFKNNAKKTELIPVGKDGISLEQLKRSDAHAVHITPSHQFPMGSVLPMKSRTALLNWANENGKYIIEDDYDSEFRFSGRPIPSLQGLDRNGRVIYLSTFSKSISPSFRLSLLVLPAELMKRYEDLFCAYSSTVSRYDQHTLLEFIEGGHFERHLNRARKLYKDRKELLERLLKRMDKRMILTGGEAGLHILLHVPDKTEAFLVTRAAQCGVKLGGLSEFFIEHKENCPPGTVVLGFASMNEEKIRAAVDALQKAWYE